MRSAKAILSKKNLLHNVGRIREISKAKIVACIKANAYGHGLRSVALRIQDKVEMFGVASIDEALALRKVGIKNEILILEGAFEKEEIEMAAEMNFALVFHSEHQINWLLKSKLPANTLKAWFKIDTGMNRLGFKTNEIAEKNYQILESCEKTKKPITIISHFASSEEKENPLNQKQIENFENFAKNKNANLSLCNSAAIFNFPHLHYDYIRPGLCLYGASPIKHKSSNELGLKPVMNLQSNIIAIKNVKKDETIGYGGRYKFEKDTKVAIVGLGYGDGIPITTKDGTKVLIKGEKCPIIGRVSMDMFAVDISNLEAPINTEVTIWGEEHPIELFVEFSDSLIYNLLTGVQYRVKFIWKDE